MDSIMTSQIFRQLFSHQTCSRLRSYSLRQSQFHTRTVRPYYQGSKEGNIRDAGRDDFWQQRTDIFPKDRSGDFDKYPMVTSDALRARRERPKRVKMLTRDFIEDSLYNPNYGYFCKKAIIFSPGEPFDFNSMASENTFHNVLGKKYTELEDKLDIDAPDDSRQLWHTPTELFLPYYGEAIARYLISNYQRNFDPYDDLIIYEMGAGNGTLMLNILDYIRALHPKTYDQTKFKIIEVSSALASLQSAQLKRTASSRGHADHVEIINRSIFTWDTYVSAPCFFLALEVFDNFAHDVIRYDPITEEPFQSAVVIDSSGDFHEFYTKKIDPVATRYLQVRNTASSGSFNHPLKEPRFIRNLKLYLPFVGNLTKAEYIPTRLMQFFDILANYFPRHRLLASDFHYLPDTIKGINAPVVQTRYQRRVVAVTTPFVQQGYFDILFPTDFPLMQEIYHALTGKLAKVLTHKKFFTHWSYVQDTQTKNGENPLLNWYANASFMITK